MSSYIDPKNWLSVFNTPLEYGIRSTVILTSASPQTFDLQRLLQYDYLLVHSKDIASVFPDAPESIHPATPNRAGELAIRREQCQIGIRLMVSRGVLLCEFGQSGITYQATDIALPFLDSFSSIYISKLRSVSNWLNGKLKDFPDESLASVFTENLGRWGAEFIMESVLGSEVEKS